MATGPGLMATTVYNLLRGAIEIEIMPFLRSPKDRHPGLFSPAPGASVGKFRTMDEFRRSGRHPPFPRRRPAPATVKPVLKTELAADLDGIRL